MPSAEFHATKSITDLYISAAFCLVLSGAGQILTASQMILCLLKNGPYGLYVSLFPIVLSEWMWSDVMISYDDR